MFLCEILVAASVIMNRMVENGEGALPLLILFLKVGKAHVTTEKS